MGNGMIYVDDYLPINKQFEGESATMYLDTKGNVTVARGLLLATTQAACVLPFLDRYGNAATPAKIVADWNMVKLMKPGSAAHFYAFPGTSALAEASIVSLTRAKVMQFDRELAAWFYGYGAFPDGVKMALLDMAYNLGTAALRETYLLFGAAVNAQDWLTAAAQCGRDSGDPAFAARNAWTKLQFMNALGRVTA